MGLGSSPTDASATIVDDSAGTVGARHRCEPRLKCLLDHPGVGDRQGVFDWQSSVSPLGQQFVRGNFGQFSDQGIPHRAGLTLGEDGSCLTGQGPSIGAILVLGCWQRAGAIGPHCVRRNGVELVLACRRRSCVRRVEIIFTCDAD